MKTYTTIAAALLSVIAALQCLRVALSWPVLINAVSVPLWASALAFVVLGWIAVGLWREAKR